MRDLLQDYDRLAARGDPVGRAVVVRTWGSAPRRPGAVLLRVKDGHMAGSVSGGCVENAVALEIDAAIEAGAPRGVSFGVSDEDAFQVGLSCGGTVELWVEPTVRSELLDRARAVPGFVHATVVSEGPDFGLACFVGEDGTAEGGLDDDAVREAALDALARLSSEVVTIGERDVFLEVIPRKPRLVIVGAVHVAEHLVPMAKALGYTTVVVDGREALLRSGRFPDADQLVHAWPKDAFEGLDLDAETYVCVLSHDPKFDEPAVHAALTSPAPYVGAIGSRKTQAKRRERLLAGGLDEAALKRLYGPIGMDLGGRAPAETALAILAEMTSVRYGGKRP